MPKVLGTVHTGKACCCSACSLDQRVELLRQGLRDRAPIVRKEAIIMVQVWLEEEQTCNWDPVKLLQLLDVQMHEGSRVFGLLVQGGARGWVVQGRGGCCVSLLF